MSEQTRSLTIPEGKALVIHGSIKAHRTELARMVASQFGRSQETDYEVVSKPSVMVQASKHKVKVLIVDCDKQDLAQPLPLLLKAAIANPVVILKGHGGLECMPSPKFIFCTGAVDFIKPGCNDRRFWAIDASKV